MNGYKYTAKPHSKESTLYLGAVRKALVKKYESLLLSAGFDPLEAQITADWIAPGPWVTDEELAEATK